MSISIKSLRYFSAVAETGSISSAMQTLNVSQAALTEAIQRLEAHLGTLLFRRHARGMALTHAGHEFARHAQVILGALSNAEAALAVRPESLRSELTIGVVSPLTGYYLPSLLERYRRSFPKVSVRIIEEGENFIENLMINGEIDVALTISSHLENPQAFHVAPLVSSPWRLWLAAGHRLAGTSPIALNDLRNEPIVTLRNEELDRTAGDLWRRAGLRPRVVVKTRSVEAARSLVATGNGIAVLPDVLFRPWSLEGGRLVAEALDNAPDPLALGLIWRRGADVSPAARAFIASAGEHQHATGHTPGH